MLDTITPKRAPGRPASGRKDTVRIMVYLPPDLAPKVRAKAEKNGQSLTEYFSHLARKDTEDSV